LYSSDSPASKCCDGRLNLFLTRLTQVILDRVDTEVRIGISDGICAVTARKCEAIDTLFGKIDGELKNMANETVDRYSGDIADKGCGHTEESVAYGDLFTEYGV